MGKQIPSLMDRLYPENNWRDYYSYPNGHLESPLWPGQFIWRNKIYIKAFQDFFLAALEPLPGSWIIYSPLAQPRGYYDRNQKSPLWAGQVILRDKSFAKTFYDSILTDLRSLHGGWIVHPPLICHQGYHDCNRGTPLWAGHFFWENASFINAFRDSILTAVEPLPKRFLIKPPRIQPLSHPGILPPRPLWAWHFIRRNESYIKAFHDAFLTALEPLPADWIVAPPLVQPYDGKETSRISHLSALHAVAETAREACRTAESSQGAGIFPPLPTSSHRGISWRRPRFLS